MESSQSRASCPHVSDWMEMKFQKLPKGCDPGSNENRSAALTCTALVCIVGGKPCDFSAPFGNKRSFWSRDRLIFSKKRPEQPPCSAQGSTTLDSHSRTSPSFRKIRHEQLLCECCSPVCTYRSSPSILNSFPPSPSFQSLTTITIADHCHASDRDNITFTFNFAGDSFAIPHRVASQADRWT